MNGFFVLLEEIFFRDGVFVGEIILLSILGEYNIDFK